MTFEKFCEKVHRIDLPEHRDNYHHQTFIGQKPYTERPFYREREEEDTDEYLVHQCETGGVSGGSCWDDSDPRPYDTGEELGRFMGLSKIVRSMSPGINFLEYEDLLDLVQTDTVSHYEYYGNSTEYALQFIKLRDLWKFLKDANHLNHLND